MSFKDKLDSILRQYIKFPKEKVDPELSREIIEAVRKLIPAKLNYPGWKSDYIKGWNACREELRRKLDE